MALYDGFVEAEKGRASHSTREAGDQRDGEEKVGAGSTVSMESLRELQRAIAAGEELIVKWGTVGVKEGVSRVLGFGDAKGTRLPLKGGLPDGAWEEFGQAFDDLGLNEDWLENSQ